MSPEFIANPYPAYAYLRENAPVVKTPYGFWLLARHEMERLPNLELDAPDKPQWRQTFTLRGLERLEEHW